MKKSTLTTMLVLSTMCGVVSSIGCSTVQKATLPAGASAQDEAVKLSADIESGYSNHYNVLDDVNFKKAEKHLKEANEEIAEQSYADALDEIAYGRAYFDLAKINSDSRRRGVEEILSAREAAISVGIKNADLMKKLRKIDSDFIDESDRFKKQLSADSFAKIQKGYYDLELEAIQENELGSVMSLIDEAKDHGAKTNAPKTLRRAETDLENAKNAIAANRHNSNSYSRACNQAKTSAQMLSEVNQVIENTVKKTSEASAVQIVLQRGTIRNLKDNLELANEENRDLSKDLSSKRNTIANLEEREQMQESLTAAQEEFSDDEAEVFQQGDKLLIRLKKVNFKPGSAKIPDQSKSLLSKVKETVMSLNPENVVVVGHTDATGTAQKNQKISEQRAKAVAEFLDMGDETLKIKTVGLGYNKPIANNKTASGRAQNRRVDIIVTPRATGSSQEEQQMD